MGIFLFANSLLRSYISLLVTHFVSGLLSTWPHLIWGRGVMCSLAMKEETGEATLF